MPEPPRAARRTKAGGAKKRPTRYAPAGSPTSDALALALRAHRKGRFAEAAARYRDVVAREPDALDAWMNLAAACVVAGRAREARGAYERATALAPGDARVQRDAGIGLAAVGHALAARAAFEAAVALAPSLVGARLGLARLCGESGDRDAALYHARRAVADAPGDPSSHLELHRALFDDRRPGPCIEAAARAVALDRGYALARFFLAGALGLDGRDAESAAALGPPGLVDDGLRDALAYAVPRCREGARCFATTRETLHAALDAAATPGLVLEFGVRHAVTTRVIAARVPGTVHAFDAFTGLPEAWQGRAPGAFSTAGELPDVPPNVRLHVGRFEDTLPAFARDAAEPPRFVHVDSDLYASARAVLDALGPRVGDGCVIAFDQYLGNASWRDDEFRAFREAVARFGWRYEYLALSWITGQGVARIRCG